MSGLTSYVKSGGDIMRDDIQKHIIHCSERYDIPPGLIRAIIQVESGGNPYAVRYEKNFRWLNEPLDRFHWHTDTERVMQKTSWGLMQIMGVIARDMGFKERFLTELLDPRINIEYGCQHLKNFYDKYNTWEKAILSYNAGSPRKNEDGEYVNQAYLDKVLKEWNP